MAKFQIVPNRSELSLEGRSSLHPIHTSTTKLQGHLEAELLDNNRLNFSVTPMGRLEVPIESLKAGNDLYDLEMQRRLDMRRYPTIVAELLQINDLKQGGRYHAIGDLSFHGVTRRFEGELTINQPNEYTLEVSGEQVFDVRDFNVTPPKVFLLKVYPEVRVMLKVVANRTD